MARPNARSSHYEPTPQGGRIAVIAATIAVASLATTRFGVPIATPPATVFAAAVVMACVGAADDVRPIPVAPRLVIQALAVAAVIYVLPDNLRILPILPWWIERLALFVGGLWFVNLVNFMDGIDWMTVAEVVPITAALAAIGLSGHLPQQAVAVSLALCGAMIGFAYFNRPAAKLFLGDVGSLPIGLLLGWLLVALAGSGGRAAAILLPLYYLADSTITLLRRLVNGEKVWQAHRSHYYPARHRSRFHRDRRGRARLHRQSHPRCARLYDPDASRTHNRPGGASRRRSARRLVAGRFRARQEIAQDRNLHLGTGRRGIGVP